MMVEQIIGGRFDGAWRACAAGVTTYGASEQDARDRMAKCLAIMNKPGARDALNAGAKIIEEMVNKEPRP